jgi:hypothetical protein
MVEGSNEKLVSMDWVKPASCDNPETQGRMVTINKTKFAHAKIRYVLG